MMALRLPAVESRATRMVFELPAVHFDPDRPATNCGEFIPVLVGPDRTAGSSIYMIAHEILEPPFDCAEACATEEMLKSNHACNRHGRLNRSRDQNELPLTIFQLHTRPDAVS